MVTDNVSGCPAPDSTGLRIAVVIASLGRPESLAQWRERIASQTRAPHAFVYSVTSDADLPAPSDRVAGGVVVMGPKGLPRQRNLGIEAVIGDCDVIAFFDDDYLPSVTAIEGIARLFGENPDIISANGRLLADGIKMEDGVSHADAMALIDAWDATPRSGYEVEEYGHGLYGCNMVYRTSAVGDVRFDERLPLYGWQEDIDFGSRLAGRGRAVRSNAFVGVHQGSKGARTPGVKLGYSQVANPFYLVEKGSVGFLWALRLVLRNVLMNHIRSSSPEPWVDRRGRARGNRMALFDLVRGRARPERILEI